MRAALYIDCVGVGAGDIPNVCEEIRRTDELILCRMYGKDKCCEEYEEAVRGLRMQRSEYGGDGYGSALVSLAADVMADAALEKVQRVYIATGDRSFVPLMEKLRFMQVDTVVIGSCKADRKLVESSQRYIYTEVINGGECTADIPSKDKIAGHIYAVSSYYNGMGANADMEQVYKSLIRKYPDFDVRNYGYTHLSTFVKKNVTGVEVTNGDRGDTYLKIVDDRKSIDEFAYEYVADRGYMIDDMAELIDALREKFPGFAMENYGYHTEYGFILSFSRFQIWENKGIKMKRSFKLSSKTEEETEEN